MSPQQGHNRTLCAITIFGLSSIVIMPTLLKAAEDKNRSQQMVNDFSAETVGAEPTSFLPAVGNWLVGNEGNNKVLIVDGPEMVGRASRRWIGRRGTDNLRIELRGVFVGKVFAKIKETSGGKGEIPKADLDPAKTSLDPKNIEGIMGVKGQMGSGVYKITIGCTIKMAGHEVGNAMDINTWAAFVGSDQQAVVDGDFVMLEKELQSVLKALRGAGINVVAIHNHIEMESPRIVFLHYWGVGSTTDLAKGLKAALDTQKK